MANIKCPDCKFVAKSNLSLGSHRHFAHGYVSPLTQKRLKNASKVSKTPVTSLQEAILVLKLEIDAMQRVVAKLEAMQ